jgi:sortase (surface protein transpeptidase)
MNNNLWNTQGIYSQSLSTLKRMDPIQIWPDPEESKPVFSPAEDSVDEKTILAYRKILEQLRLEELQKETELSLEMLQQEKILYKKELKPKVKAVEQEKAKPVVKRGVRKIYQFVIIFAILSAILSNSWFVFASLSQQNSSPRIFPSTLPNGFLQPIFNVNTYNNPPAKLIIPSIGVDAAVQQIGQTPEGAIDVPNNTTDVGWYKFGPVPGQEGTAVIDAHFDNPNGFPAVFGRLRDLKTGDIITVKDSENRSINFKVRRVGNFTMDQKVSDILGENDRGIHLALITCSGIWDINKETYTERLVVLADKVEISTDNSK